ncbi:hypothetical protein [Nocardia gipuzkoensis]|uniref:hypothetical protein n=1 Tax=Nocardia gipuzkoensis TaxID=2749991 RepID=UPI0015EEBACB|nr:hypothetical protein [Nocardia gipuzkoensis]
MTDELVTTLVVIASVLFGLWLIFDGLPRFLERGAKRPAELSRVESFSTPAEYDCHPAPVVPFTVAQARIVMQKLIRCDAERCDCKAAAFRVLVEAGLVKPAKALR